MFFKLKEIIEPFSENTNVNKFLFIVKNVIPLMRRRKFNYHYCEILLLFQQWKMRNFTIYYYYFIVTNLLLMVS